MGGQEVRGQLWRWAGQPVCRWAAQGLWSLFSSLGMKDPIHPAAAGLRFSSGLSRVPERVLKAEGIMERLQPGRGAGCDAMKILRKLPGLMDGSRRPRS